MVISNIEKSVEEIKDRKIRVNLTISKILSDRLEKFKKKKGIKTISPLVEVMIKDWLNDAESIEAKKELVNKIISFLESPDFKKRGCVEDMIRGIDIEMSLLRGEYEFNNEKEDFDGESLELLQWTLLNRIITLIDNLPRSRESEKLASVRKKIMSQSRELYKVVEKEVFKKIKEDGSQ